MMTSRDQHRAPVRLAGGTRQSEPTRTRPQRVLPDAPNTPMPRLVRDYDEVESSPGSGRHTQTPFYREPAPRGPDGEPVRQTGAYEIAKADPIQPAEEEPVLPPPQPVSAEMAGAYAVQGAPSKLRPTERFQMFQMLMHAVELHDDEWRLAGIHADERKRALIAYLVPRNTRMDLKTAYSRRQVKRIMIDSRGNTAIQDPPRRGFFGLFRSWLFGD
ncbi:MAG: hypothetical protein JXJ20_15050 [Anaerolineae bacterium]|jgi:hypothetical protein|nr:hypothetical protein [Anaerolineae bacterium]